MLTWGAAMQVWTRARNGGAYSAVWLLLSFSISGCAASRPDALTRSRMLVDEGRSPQAARELEAYVQQHPEAVAERRLLIRVDGSMGQLGRAEQQARALAKRLGRASPIPWVELGYALEFAHDYDEALAEYDHAADVAPRDALGPLTGGLRAARWGEFELAEPRLIEALHRDPNRAAAWHALGLVRVQRGNLDGASFAYTSGLRADPQAVEDHLGLATIALLREDAPQALREYNAITRLRPELADAQLGRAWALLKLGRLDDAAQALNRADELHANPNALAAQRRALAALRRAPLVR